MINLHLLTVDDVTANWGFPVKLFHFFLSIGKYCIDCLSLCKSGGVFPVYCLSLCYFNQYEFIRSLSVAGKLVNNQIPWRGDSALKDGDEEGLDLSKGMYDAGDHIKFGFPLAFTATILSWGILEYGDQMSAAKYLEPAHESLKWITDYLVNCHPSENVLVIQVIHLK